MGERLSTNTQRSVWHISIYYLIDRSKKMKMRISFSVIIFLAFIRVAVAQRIYKYNAPGNDCYSEMVFEEKAIHPKGVIVIDVKGQDIAAYSQNNAYINSGLFLNYNFLYINVLNQGAVSATSCLDVILATVASMHRLSKSVFYVMVSSSNSQKALIQKANNDGEGFNLLYGGSLENKEIVNVLDDATKNQVYRMPLSIALSGDLEAEAKKRNYKQNFDLGIYLLPLFLNGAELGIKQRAVTNYGLSLAKNIGTQLTLKANFGGAFKRPDQSAIQSAMQSKMQEAIKNGDSTIAIDQTLSGHVMIGGDFSFKYYFAKTKLFRPYTSIGIGAYNITAISGRIQDTIDISGIDPQNPSSMQGVLGGSAASGSAPAGMNTIRTSFLAPQVEVGFEYRLAPIAKVNVSIPFKYFVDKTSATLNTFTFGINLGLSFTLNPGKFPRTSEQKKSK